MSDAFTQVENAQNEVMTDQGLTGIFTGLAAAQHSPTPALSVDLTAGIARDPNGQRISTPSMTVNVAQDSSSVSTAVAGSGNEKWVSITVLFNRALSNPRVDGNSETIYYDENESYTIEVVQGAEATISSATKPSLDPNGLLLCDVHLVHGQAQVLNADIDITRRQDTYAMAAPPGGLGIRAGQPKAAIQAMLDALNTHILGLGGEHVATAVDYAGSSNGFADATGLSAATVEATLDTLVNLLGATTTPSGSKKIGGIAQAVFSGAPFPATATHLEAQLTTLFAAVNASYRIRTYTGSATIDVSFNDALALLDVAGGSFTLTLTNPANATGRRIRFKDKKQLLSPTTTVTLARFGTEKIEGVAASYVFNVTGGSWVLECDGTDWYFV